MTKFDRLLTDIAKMHLGIPTLTTQRSDSLDFHVVAVWSVKAALAAAYEAGEEGSGSPSDPAAAVPSP